MHVSDFALRFDKSKLNFRSATVSKHLLPATLRTSMDRQSLERERSSLSIERTELQRYVGKLSEKLPLAGLSESARIEIEIEDCEQRIKNIEVRLDVITEELKGLGEGSATPSAEQPADGRRKTQGDRSISSGRNTNISGTVITGDIDGNVIIGG